MVITFIPSTELDTYSSLDFDRFFERLDVLLISELVGIDSILFSYFPKLNKPMILEPMELLFLTSS